MKTKTKRDKINMANLNFIDITNNIVNPKFKGLENWLYATSERYKLEVKEL